MTALGLWLQLAGATVIILAAATFLTRSADRISDATGLGRSLAGLVLLATATSLPELVTGVGSVALLDEPDLAAGAAFGSNMVNLLMIGLLDAFWRSGPILDSLGLAFVAQAVFGIAIICLAALGLLIHSTTASFAGWYLSPVLCCCLERSWWRCTRCSRGERRTRRQKTSLSSLMRSPWR